MLIGILAGVAILFILIAASLVLFFRTRDSIPCCKRRRQQRSETAARSRHFDGTRIELRELQYPPPAYKGYEKSGTMV
ncbi:uncharacterized protein EV420DRAFT_1572514 [Desarmillaria tabescens]|uniref:Uncharacterized protein n=1 Tax=Armillaria tabescens TaxID=1929756 RepID=A0AA39JRN5_ARMTA|nr:uncharacterized protein EV420DRAFT_1572514 [Desarmillaria tabescens]KAK0445333.1 hypothetical protein EV420DRAFT_1572514 [Desarmillaria tabescens]